MSPAGSSRSSRRPGFEKFFEELDALGGALEADPEALAALNERYGLEMQPETRPASLLERFGLRDRRAPVDGRALAAPARRRG